MTAAANPTIWFIDVEASGFGAGSYPIEIAFACSQDAIESYLVCPAPSWTHWSDDAERLHGLSRERLLSEGKPADFIAQWLNSTLNGRTLYSDAWHYDFSWIHRLFSEVGALPEFKMASIEELLTQEQSKLWAICKADVAASLQLTQHRAANDVRLLLATFEAVSQL
jgi:hypothetical protein